MKEVVKIVTDSGGVFDSERDATRALQDMMHTQLSAVAHRLVHCTKYTAIKDELLRSIDVLASIAKIQKELQKGVEPLDD